jgi:hypothetical protein
VVLFADLGVVVDLEAELLGVEGFGAVHVGDGDHHHLERPVHECLTFGFVGTVPFLWGFA